MIRFPFNERKAAQAAAYLLRQHGGAYSYIGLLKLMYLADRRALVETGTPITGDAIVSMPYGPVLSKVKDCLTGWSGAGEAWMQFVSRNENNLVRLCDETGTCDELSEYETELLHRINQEHGWRQPFELVELTHQLPEWRDPSGSADPIDPLDILKAEGVAEGRIQQIAADAEELVRLHELGGSGV